MLPQRSSQPKEHDFFTFVYQRQLIWYKRFVLQEPAPWSTDPILSCYKIINMYRELDRCTLYLLDKLRSISDRRTLLLNIIFYRFFNRDHLYEELGLAPFSSLDASLRDVLIEKFSALKKTQPIFNSAYLISSGGSGVKHAHILDALSALDLSRLVAQLDACTTPQTSLDVLMQIPLVGPFLACEIWTDLTYFHFFVQGWTDNDFVHIGPGAKWGLELLYGKLSRKQLWQKLLWLHHQQQEILPLMHTTLGRSLSWHDIAYHDAFSSYPFLSLTNVEGALCEFRKYWRISSGLGRRKYFAPVVAQRLNKTPAAPF